MGPRSVIFGLVLLGGFPARAEEDRRLVRGQDVIAVDEETNDVLVVEGRLDVEGSIRGHLYAIDADVFVRNTAVILGSVTTRGGSLHLEEGAVLPETLELFGTDYYDRRGHRSPGRAKVKLASGAAMLSMHPVSTSSLTEALTRAVLPFERFVPPDDTPTSALAAWSPGLGLDPVATSKSGDALSIGGLIRMRFVSDRVRSSVQTSFDGPRGKVRLTVVRLDATADAADLWQRLAKTPVVGATRISIKSSLGDGSHWFFRSRGRYATVWQRGPWLLAVESRLADDRASILQQQQFNQQVSSAFARRMPGRDSTESKP